MARSTISANCDTNLRRKDIAFGPSQIPRFYFMHSQPGAQSACGISVACSHLLFGAQQSALCFCFAIRWASSRSTIGFRRAAALCSHRNSRPCWRFRGFGRPLDRRAIGQFLEFGYTFEDDRTILNGVHKLPPGHFLRVRANEKPELERYFRPEVASDQHREAERCRGGAPCHA